MAGTINVQCSLEVTHGNFRLPKQGSSLLSFDQTNPGAGSPGFVHVPTTGVDVDLSEFTTVGWARLHNTDETNEVDFGVHDGVTFHPLGKMKANEPAQFRLYPGANLHLKANTAECIVQVIVCED